MEGGPKQWIFIRLKRSLRSHARIPGAAHSGNGTARRARQPPPARRRHSPSRSIQFEKQRPLVWQRYGVAKHCGHDLIIAFPLSRPHSHAKVASGHADQAHHQASDWPNSANKLVTIGGNLPTGEMLNRPEVSNHLIFLLVFLQHSAGILARRLPCRR
jgi:hypothetical protein